MSDIISDYEHLLRLRDFYRRGDKPMHDKAYQQIKDSLSKEYAANLDEKIERWIQTTKVEFFWDKKPAETHIQAKMLFRDGFFEACISLCRTICEMICYEILERTSHPFGDNGSIEQENFRTLLKFIALPKTFPKEAFIKLLNSIPPSDEKNFLKSSYVLQQGKYFFKKENGKTAKNLNRLMEPLRKVENFSYDTFSENAFIYLNDIYDLASDYIHGRKRDQVEEDSFNSLDKIGLVVFELYGVKKFEELIGKSVETAYTRFPKICVGQNFYLEAFLTPEAAFSISEKYSKKTK